jgi:hypothetical protein
MVDQENENRTFGHDIDPISEMRIVISFEIRENGLQIKRGKRKVVQQ